MSGETPNNNDWNDKSNWSPPSSLECSKADATTLSSISDANLGFSINAGHQIKLFGLGLLTKLPWRVPQMPKDIIQIYWYDTDMQLRHLYGGGDDFLLCYISSFGDDFTERVTSIL